MDLYLSQRAQAVTPFLAMEIMELAKARQAEGHDVLYLCLGEPDFPTPEPITRAAIEAIRSGHTTYTHSLGLPELRSEICRHYQQSYGVRIDPDQVIVSSGTSPLLLLLFAALLNEGDEVILGNPSYACYANTVRFNGGKAVEVATHSENGFQLCAEDIARARTSRTRAVLINSPSNPAGSLLDADSLRAIAALGLPVVADEIYHGLSYDEPEHSILEFTDQAFVLGGFSKTYAMTGWRLGYLIVPPATVRTLRNLHQNFVICANSFVQYAGIAALRHCQPDVARMRAAYNERRLFLIEALQQLGLPLPCLPSGAFYLLADCRHLSTDSVALAREILTRTNIALTPGIDFGSNCEGFLRFSYATSLDTLQQAVERLRTWLSTRTAAG